MQTNTDLKTTYIKIKYNCKNSSIIHKDYQNAFFTKDI